MKYLTLKEIAERLGKPYPSIVNYAARQEIFDALFAYALVERNGHFGLRKYKVAVLPENNLEAFARIIESTKKGRPVINSKWSPAAIECYRNNLICADCPNKTICQNITDTSISEKPPIKKVVLQLFSQYGPPILIKKTEKNSESE